MNFPADTTGAERRARCRPEVYRYRYPSAQIAMGHTLKSSIYACHELEVYPGDRLTCASGSAGIVFDMKNAFDDNGTPNNFADDKPRGTPLPCKVRPSSSEAPFGTGAMVTDCVSGERNGAPAGLDVPSWLADGAPSLEGVRYVGSAHHMGRGAGGSATPTYNSDQDVDFDHEFEFTASRRYLLATDERGGGVLPPGATCAPGADNKSGNGGVHAYRVGMLRTTGPGTPADSFKSYAITPDGKKAIYRAPIRTGPQAAFCTAHVFQQVPGQNRIFMGWYSQGTQVVDFVERRGGTIDFKETAYFIPANANQWVSAVFKMKQNPNGTFTYWGATGDFNLGTVGRSAIDIWKVTLPAPQQ
jgi:hypothetical protein